MRYRLLLLTCLGLAAPAFARAQDRSVTLTGKVLDSVSHSPIEKADVYLPGEGEPHASTNRVGEFRLKSVPADEVILLIRRIGYSPRALRLNLSDRENRTMDLGTLSLNSFAVRLDSITIETRLVQRNPRLADFYRRKQTGMGQYLTRQDIFERNPMKTTDLMRTVPGLTVECESMGECVPASTRKIGMGEVTCPMRVILDGLPTSVGLDLIPPAWIAGVEIYRSSAFLPLELTSRGTVSDQNAGCGTLVVWTGADDY